MRPITSHQNPIIKLIRSLELKKHRKETGLFVAEGGKVLDRARTEGWEPDYLLSVHERQPWGKAEVLLVTDAIMQTISGQRNPPDVVGIFKQRFHDEIKATAVTEIWIALENIRDPGNLGTIIRTVDAVAAKGVILIDQSCDPYSPESVRATMGSIFGVPLFRMESAEFLQICGAWPGETVATDANARTSFRRKYRGPSMLVMGSEGDGLSPALAAGCNTHVAIPMAGGTESLNIAIASALMLYEAAFAEDVS